MALTDIAHQSILDYFSDRPLRRSIDATCGNGHDTLFLATHSGEQVWGFDVQQRALAATRHRLDTAGHSHVTLIHDGHQRMSDHVNGPVDCIMFNFGYLPNGDNALTTQAETSLLALEVSLTCLADHALITLLCYPGHAAGKQETDAITQWLQNLASPFSVTTYRGHARENSPILHVIMKSN